MMGSLMLVRQPLHRQTPSTTNGSLFRSMYTLLVRRASQSARTEKTKSWSHLWTLLSNATPRNTRPPNDAARIPARSGAPYVRTVRLADDDRSRFPLQQKNKNEWARHPSPHKLYQAGCSAVSKPIPASQLGMMNPH